MFKLETFINDSFYLYAISLQLKYSTIIDIVLFIYNFHVADTKFFEYLSLSRKDTKAWDERCLCANCHWLSGS